MTCIVLSSSVHHTPLRLFRQGEEYEDNRRKKRQDKALKEEESFEGAFHPRINSQGEPSMRMETSVVHRCHAWHAAKERRVEEERSRRAQEMADEEILECSFHPALMTDDFSSRSDSNQSSDCFACLFFRTRQA